MQILDRIPKNIDIVLTGRYAPKGLFDRAEFVNEVKDLKSPKQMVTAKGIQY